MSKTFAIRKSPVILLCTAMVALAGCSEDKKFSFDSLKKKPDEAAAAASPSVPTAKEGEGKDVEAPDVFEATEAGLWDGRPSLGGIWVAHPDVVDPERVIIKNTANDKTVVGALFRREREIPGPRLQISSDAAESLGMLAGAPSQLSVVALRREVVPEPAPVEPVEEIDETEGVDAPAEVTETSLDPIASAAAAIEDTAPADPNIDPAAVAATAASATPEPTSKPAKIPLSKPYIQVGIFSVEDNANRIAEQLRGVGLKPTVNAQTSNEKPIWRVIVGPANNRSERKEMLTKIKAEGFSDAYTVTN